MVKVLVTGILIAFFISGLAVPRVGKPAKGVVHPCCGNNCCCPQGNCQCGDAHAGGQAQVSEHLGYTQEEKGGSPEVSFWRHPDCGGLPTVFTSTWHDSYLLLSNPPTFLLAPFWSIEGPEVFRLKDPFLSPPYKPPRRHT
ncbi:MAG: hypothetical protein Q6354_04655 [Candidatus Brocadiales bacterium]|nr:hypothetical protein [Candidatus Brocadiales bacterium]